MSETKHTPGPWRVRTLADDDGEITDCFVAAADVNGFPYDAQILGDDEYRGDVGRMLADARLIAAAPTLLAACEEAEAVIAQGAAYRGSGVSVAEERAITALRAAIAEAKGTSK